jgi:hypothetical protein
VESIEGPGEADEHILTLALARLLTPEYYVKRKT